VALPGPPVVVEVVLVAAVAPDTGPVVEVPPPEPWLPPDPLGTVVDEVAVEEPPLPGTVVELTDANPGPPVGQLVALVMPPAGLADPWFVPDTASPAAAPPLPVPEDEEPSEPPFARRADVAPP